MAWRLKGEQFEPIIRLSMIDQRESADFIDLDHAMVAEKVAEMTVVERVVEADSMEGRIDIIEIMHHVTTDDEIDPTLAAEDDIDHPTIEDEKTNDEIEADPVQHHHTIDDDDQDHHHRHAAVRF